MSGGLLTTEEIAALDQDVCPMLSSGPGSTVKLGTLLNDMDATRNPSGVANLYVDSNLAATAGSGYTWDTAFKTLTEAFAANNALLALNRANGGAPYWAGRNRAFYKGDANAETLTTLGEKMDVIGVGSGGGGRPHPQIVGTHVISAVAYSSCRFINMGFAPAAAGNDTFTISGGQHGLAFLGCFFESGIGAGQGGSALVLTANARVHIKWCDFLGPFSDSVIECLSGNNQGMIIKNNYIEGANAGIEFAAGVTSAGGSHILVQGNTIRTGTECILDTASIASIVGNRMTTAQASGASGAGTVVGNVDFSMDNHISASDEENNLWPAPSGL